MMTLSSSVFVCNKQEDGRRMQNVVVRMLRDFVELRPGDCVLQNGANSAVGQVMVDQ